MTWNKKAGKVISKQNAKDMIDKYQKAHKDSVKSVYFDLDVIKGLINVPGTAGVSIFFAKNEKNDNTVVLMPVDENGKIIYETSESSEISASSSRDTAVEVGAPCPPYCPS